MSATPSQEETTDVDAQTTALIINVIVGISITVVSVLVFDLLLRKRVPSVFEARRTLNTRGIELDYFGYRVSYPSSPSYRPFGWLGPVRRIDLEKVIDSHGLDTALFLRYLRLMIYLFTFLTVTSIMVLPIYYTGTNKDLGQNDPSRTLGVNKFSLANLSKDDPWRFWFTFAIELVISVATCHFLRNEFMHYSAARRRYRSSKNPANYTILVQDIPEPNFSEEAVRHYWNKIFPGQVARVYVIYDARKLVSEKAKFWNAVTKRERAEWEAEYNPKLNGARPTHKTGYGACACLSSKREDSIDYWTEKQSQLYSEISLQQSEVDTTQFASTRAAFVVFKSRIVASLAAQTNFASNEHLWRVYRAPEPKAVNWSSLSIPPWQLPARHAVTAVSSVALTLFWAIPVTFIMGLANLNALAAIDVNGQKPFAFLNAVAGWPKAVVGFIEGLLPAIILSVFLSLVPIFFRLFLNLSRVPSNASVDKLVRDWYFNFVVFSNFLFVAFAGTLLTDLQRILEQPVLVVDLLAAAIPKQGAFIMNFVLLKALSESPQELMQIVRVALRWIMLKFFARTTREKDKVETGNTVFVYLRYYAIAQLIALLGMIYSTIQPFINVICLVYFLVNYVVWKYNLCFSMYNPYQDGGRMYGGALYGLWIGLFLHQLTMIGLFGLNKNPAQAILIVIPAVLSVLFLRYCRVSFNRVIEHGSALDTQRLVEDEGEEDLIDKNLANKYIHPGYEPLPDPIENLNGVEEREEEVEAAELDDVEDQKRTVKESEAQGSRMTQPISMSSEDWKDAHSTSQSSNKDVSS